MVFRIFDFNIFQQEVPTSLSGGGMPLYGREIIIFDISKRNKGKRTTNKRFSRYMREFYVAFPKCHALSDKLSWTHYRYIVKIDDAYA